MGVCSGLGPIAQDGPQALGRSLIAEDRLGGEYRIESQHGAAIVSHGRNPGQGGPWAQRCGPTGIAFAGLQVAGADCVVNGVLWQ